MPYLRQILTSKPQKSSQNTSPLNFCDDLSFECFYRNLARGVATLVLKEIFASLHSQLQAEENFNLRQASCLVLVKIFCTTFKIILRYFALTFYVQI